MKTHHHIKVKSGGILKKKTKQPKGLKQLKGVQTFVNPIETGSCGMFFTVNDGHEKHALREAVELVDNFLSMMPGTTSGMEAENELLQKLSKTCEVRIGTSQPFSPNVKQLDTGVKNSIFIMANGINRERIYDFVDVIVDECQTNVKCKYLSKVLPIEDACPADLQSIQTAMKSVVRSQLATICLPEGHLPTFGVDFNKRGSGISIKREEIIDLVDTLVTNLCPGARVSLANPDMLFIVNVIREVALLCCVRNYNTRKKFSILGDNKGWPQTNETSIGASSALDNSASMES